MRKRSVKRIGLVVSGSAVLVVVIAVVSGSIWADSGSSSRVEAEPIESVRRVADEPNRLWLTISTQGLCKGLERRPKLEPLEIVESDDGTAIVIGNVRYSPRRDGYCMGMGFGVGEKVRFATPVNKLVLYDGSFDPPRKIWPR